MKDSSLKSFLTCIGVKKIYANFSQKKYDRKVAREQKKNRPDRWYFTFLPIKKNKIVFDNFMGKGYGGDPKAIVEEIIRQNLNWDLVWLTKGHVEMPASIRQVEYGSIKAMRELATSRIWVFNTRSVKHPKKKKNQVYVHTWHSAFPFKLIEKQVEDRLNESYVRAAKKDGEICDAVVSGSSVLSEVYEKYFWLNDKAQILEYGAPSNDVLFDSDKHAIFNSSIRKLYGIPDSAKVVLYMPTFRDDGSVDCYDLDYNRIINTFEKKFNKSFYLLIRFHPNVKTDNLFEEKNNIINVTSYPEANELHAVADYLISDYSGVIFDFALLKKPVFIYAKDYDIYRTARGFNEYYNKLPFPIAYTNEDLEQNIMNFDETDCLNKWKQYMKDIKVFGNGTASKKVVKWLISVRLNKE